MPDDAGGKPAAPVPRLHGQRPRAARQHPEVDLPVSRLHVVRDLLAPVRAVRRPAHGHVKTRGIVFRPRLGMIPVGDVVADAHGRSLAHRRLDVVSRDVRILEMVRRPVVAELDLLSGSGIRQVARQHRRSGRGQSQRQRQCQESRLHVMGSPLELLQVWPFLVRSHSASVPCRQNNQMTAVCRPWEARRIRD